MIRHLLLAIILLSVNPVHAQGAPLQDPIYEKLSDAKSAYVTDVAKAAKLVVAAIDTQIERAKKSSGMKVDEQIAMLKELIAQRKAFVEDPTQIPPHRSLKSVTKKFSTKLRASKKKLMNAFDDAADKYRKPPMKDFAAAAKILEERDTFFEKLKRGKVKGDAKNLGFDPAFEGENWSVTWPKNVTIKDDRLIISASQDGNIVLTKKTDYQEPTVVVEVAAAAETEAYVILNAQQRNGKWTGVTSKIHFAEGKISAGGQRTGFRGNTGNNDPFDVGEYFTLELYVHKHPKNDSTMLVRSSVNGDRTGHINYEKSKSNVTGAVGFMVKKGALSIKSFSVSQE